MNSDNLLEILFALVYFLGSAVYDYVKKRKKLREMEAAPPPEPLVEEPGYPDDEPFDDAVSPTEPPPVLDTPLPKPTMVAAPRKRDSLRPVLIQAVGDWERLARPVIGSREAGRVRAVLKGLLPGFEPDVLWKDSDESVAAIYLDALRELSSHLREGTQGPSFLVGLAGGQVLNPLLEALHDDPATPPDVIVPVAWNLRGNVSTLAQLCGYWPLILTPGGHQALGVFSVMQQGMLDILLGRLEVAQHFARVARQFLGDYLLDEEARDPEVVFALKRYGGVQLVVQGLAGAWLVRATGPLLHYGLSDSPSGLSASVPPGLAYGLARLGDDSETTKSSQGWQDFADRLAKSLDEISLPHQSFRFGELSERWSAHDAKEQAMLIQWTLNPKGATSLKGRIDPLLALLSFLGSTFTTGFVPEKEAVEALKHAILIGISPKKRAPKVHHELPSKPVRRDPFSAKDAFLLQVILGAPRAQVRVGPKALRQASQRGPAQRARI